MGGSLVGRESQSPRCAFFRSPTEAPGVFDVVRRTSAGMLFGFLAVERQGRRSHHYPSSTPNWTQRAPCRTSNRVATELMAGTVQPVACERSPSAQGRCMNVVTTYAPTAEK